MEKAKQDLDPASQGWAAFVRGRVLGESSICVGEEFPACRGEQELRKEAGSSPTECSTGICALVDSPYITVNLIKYIVIPIEGILISWDRNKSFSLFLQMKTSTLFCRESMSLADWLAPWSPHRLLQPHPLLLRLIRQVPRVEFWGWARASWEGEGAWPTRSGH